MSDRDVTFSMKLEADPAGVQSVDDLKASVDDVNKSLEKTQEVSNKTTLKMAEGFERAATGTMKLARGIAFIAASSDKDLKNMLNTLVKIQGAVDIGSGTLQTLRGVIQAYDQWALKAKSVATANELLAASNVKVATTGQMASAAGGGINGRGARLAGVAGVGVGGALGFGYAQQQGYGEFGTLGSTVGGAVAGGLLFETGAAGARRYGPSVIRGVGGFFGLGGGAAAGSGAAGAGAGSSFLGGLGTLGALAGTATIGAGLAFGNQGSALINREETGENKGTLGIAKEAFGLWRENRGRRSNLNEQMDFRSSPEFTNSLLQSRNAQNLQSLGTDELRMNARIAQSNAFEADPFKRSSFTLDTLKGRQKQLGVTEFKLRNESFGGGDEKEQASIQQELLNTISQRARVEQQITQQMEARGNLLMTEIENTEKTLELNKQLRSTKLQTFGSASRVDQLRTAKAFQRFESGDTKETTLRQLEKFGIARERIGKIRETAGLQSARDLGLSNVITKDEDSNIKTQTHKLHNMEQGLDQAKQEFNAASEKTFLTVTKTLTDANEALNKITKLLESNEQLRNLGSR